MDVVYNQFAFVYYETANEQGKTRVTLIHYVSSNAQSKFLGIGRLHTQPHE